MNTKHYTRLGRLVTPSGLPTLIQNWADWTGDLLNNILLKNLHISSSPASSQTNYSFDALIKEDIGFNFPGTEFRFVLNPSFDPSGPPTEIPCYAGFVIQHNSFITKIRNKI